MYRQILQLLARGQEYPRGDFCQRLRVNPSELAQAIRNLSEYGVKFNSGGGYQLVEPIELLDQARILATLSELTKRRLARLEILDVIDSTNRYAFDQPDEGTSVYLAEYQTAGRGRQGRRWISPYAGGLCLSFRHVYDHLAYPLTGLNLAVAITVVQVLKSLGIDKVGIKWPNDILWEGRKLAGLLLETRRVNQGYQIVMGIGINIKMGNCEGIDQPWVDLCTVVGNLLSRNQLAALLIEQGLQTLTCYPQQGLIAWLPAWSTMDLLDGRTVTLSNALQTITGIAAGIDDQGALLLQVGRYRQRYLEGEVYEINGGFRK